ncbi:hypothetical protein CDES_08990 [Corynebacterium deserti GIMN1.010]|uniref:Secreted protein n=1 Tax=Corynebacterium deserti GIMN1.010 TaxID=931089 RepID=A0A0M4CGP5_9CORY|nr:hypothetical protein [Corynebacterium deserti]ALC06190.1 hypothetical protein CDES_08990 [Corynebacterium deserti GIMN1.010]
MRSFRTAAVAGLTAVALSVGSASVATAAEDDRASLSSGFAALSSGGAEAVGKDWDADQPVTGEDIFGDEHKRDDENTPAWAKNMYDLTLLGGIASLLGVIVFPAYNYLVYTGVIKG